MTTTRPLDITAAQHGVAGFLTGGHVSDVTVADDLHAEVVGSYVVAERGYERNRHQSANRREAYDKSSV